MGTLGHGNHGNTLTGVLSRVHGPVVDGNCLNKVGRTEGQTPGAYMRGSTPRPAPTAQLTAPRASRPSPSRALCHAAIAFLRTIVKLDFMFIDRT